MVPIEKGLQWGNVKQIPDLGIFTHIPAYSGIIRHRNQAYLRIIQTCSEPCVTLAYLETWYIQNPGIVKTRSIFRTRSKFRTLHIQNPGIFRTLVYSESWHIQNPGIFQHPGIFTTLAYSEPWYIQNPGIFTTLVY